MASRVTAPYLVGFGLPDTRVNRDTLDASSVYSQTGPHPGSAVPNDSRSELRVQLSGQQSDDYVVQMTAAGAPALSKGCRGAYRKDTEAASQLRGWNPGNLLQGWVPAEYAAAASATYSQPAACVIPSTQEVVSVYGRLVGGSTNHARRFNPYTATWSASATISTEGGTGSIWAVTCLPGNERCLALLADNNVVAAGKMYFSDDKGDTWSIWGDGLFDVSLTSVTSWYRARLLVVGSDLLLVLVADQAGTTHLHQFASSNLGASFRRIVDWSSPGGTPDVVQLGNGKIGVVTIGTGSRPNWRSVSSAWDAFDDAGAIEIDAAQTVSEVVAVVDQAGSILVYGRASENWHVWKSDDDGATWRKFDVGLWDSTDASTYPTNLAPVAAAGAIQIVHQWAANPGDEDLSVAVLTAGGWSNATMDVYHTGAVATVDVDSERVAYGATIVAGASNVTWLPFDLPEDCGWTKTGAGTSTLVAAGAVELVTSGANQAFYTPPGSIGTATRFLGLFEVQVTAGGALATNDVAIRLELSDGVNGHQIVLRFNTTGFRVRDTTAAVNRVDVAVDMTQWLQVQVNARQSNVGSQLLEVLYRRPGSSTWTLAYSGTMASGALATGTLEVGNINAAAATSRWRIMAASWGWAGNAWDYAGSSSTGHNTVIGRTITAKGFPLGDSATAGATFVRAIDGPARVGETHTIDVVYDYGVDRLFYDLYPSPDDEWRSSSTATQQEFIFAPAGGSTDTALGSRSLLLIVHSANMRTIYVDGDAGAGWVQLGEYDGSIGFTGLTCVLNGDQVSPNTASTANAGRYVQRNEHVGATAVCNGAYRKILAHEEGAWTQSTTRRPRYTIQSPAGAASGTFSIIAKRGVLVIHNVSTVYRKFRVRIPVQTTADGDFRLKFTLAGLVMPGIPWSWGWTWSDNPNVTKTKTRRGTTRIREEGVPQRILTFGYPEGVPLQTLRSGLDLGWLAGDAAHPALAARGDVPWLLSGLLRDCRSGQIPLAVLLSVPQVSTYTTITDPTLWLWGTPEGPIQRATVAGKPGSTEFVRVENWSIEELV
jgi:hypothetical protein